MWFSTIILQIKQFIYKKKIKIGILNWKWLKSIINKNYITHISIARLSNNYVSVFLTRLR